MEECEGPGGYGMGVPGGCGVCGYGTGIRKGFSVRIPFPARPGVGEVPTSREACRPRPSRRVARRSP